MFEAKETPQVTSDVAVTESKEPDLTILRSVALMPALTESVDASGVTHPDWSGAESLAQSEQQSLWTAFSEARREIRPLTEHQRTMAENEGADYLVSNPGQRIRARFLEDGVRVLSSYAGREWQLELGLEGAVAGLVRQSGSRLEYDRGAITEWYHNRPEGLEHGFIVDQKTAELTEPESGVLRIRLRAEGLRVQELEGRAEGSSDLQLVNAAGEPVLAYEKLVVWDAEGVEFPARMEATASGIEILVADTGARYPVVIDPLIVSLEQNLGPEVTGDGTAEDYFGYSVSVSGDTALVGAYGDDDNGFTSGSAYIFVRNASVWTLEQKITADDGVGGDRFADSVSLSGDTAVIGARHDDDNGTNSGSAYVFVRTAGTWTQLQKLTPSDGAGSDRFGISVSVDGDTILVGADLDDDNGSSSGSAYVFVRSGTSWTQQQKLTASDAALGDLFGYSVSLSSDTAIVGTPYDDDNGTDSGSAYIFVRSGSTWTQQQKLTASDGSFGDLFGWSVSLSGDTVIAGSPEYDDGLTNRGAAYVYVRSGTTWSQQQKIVAADGAGGDRLGHSVSLEDDTVVIGAAEEDNTNGFQAGSAYVFVRSGTSWSQEQKLIAADGSDNDYLGYSVSLSGDTVIAGAYLDDDAGFSSGSAYVFVRSDSVWSQEQKLTAGDSAIDDRFGTSVSVNGDTALIGAEQDSDNGNLSGSAYVFVRSGDIWTQQQKLISVDGEAGDRFGHSVSLDGDTAVIGAHQDDDNGSNSGSAYVFVRSGSSWTQQQKLTTGSGTDDNFGHSVSVDGDIALISDHKENFNQGSVHVYVRTGSSWSREEILTASDASNSDFFGYSVSMSGDTALIGAYQDDVNDFDSGSAYVFVHSGGVWAEQQKLSAADGMEDDFFGFSVSLTGDTALIGAYQGDVHASGNGKAYVFIRSGSVWSLQQTLTAGDGAADDDFGWSVSVSGDTALIGAYRDDDDGSASGSAYVFTRTGGVWSELQKLTAGVGAAGDEFGYSVSVDGDTALVGVHKDDGLDLSGNIATDQGSVYVYRIVDPDQDSDGDGLPDLVETDTGTYVSTSDTGSDPNDADSDDDGLNDGDEVNVHGTDPNNADSDDDGYMDAAEIAAGTDPNSAASEPDPTVFTEVEGFAPSVVTRIGNSYDLDWNADLNPAGWSTLYEDQSGTGERMYLFVSPQEGEDKGFWRFVETQP